MRQLSAAIHSISKSLGEVTLFGLLSSMMDCDASWVPRDGWPSFSSSREPAAQMWAHHVERSTPNTHETWSGTGTEHQAISVRRIRKKKEKGANDATGVV